MQSKLMVFLVVFSIIFALNILFQYLQYYIKCKYNQLVYNSSLNTYGVL